MLKELKYTTIHGISVYVRLYDRIIVVGGDSSSGKSFLKDTAQRYYNDAEKVVIEVFDYRRALLSPEALRSIKGCLIIIDNADIFLQNNEALAKYINRDGKNQYLLFMRSENGIDVSIDNYCELVQDGKTLTAVYDYR